MLDVSKPASHHDVTSCFTRDQKGSYFNGSGYAALSESSINQRKYTLVQSDLMSDESVNLCVCSVRDGYKVGSDMSVSMEFRTSQSEGVLLGLSSAKVDAIGLEMINGQVKRNLFVCV